MPALDPFLIATPLAALLAGLAGFVAHQFRCEERFAARALRLLARAEAQVKRLVEQSDGSFTLRDLGDWSVAFGKTGYNGSEYQRAWQLLGWDVSHLAPISFYLGLSGAEGVDVSLGSDLGTGGSGHRQWDLGVLGFAGMGLPGLCGFIGEVRAAGERTGVSRI